MRVIGYTTGRCMLAVALFYSMTGHCDEAL
jgi:hypothetical protein